MGTNIDPPSAFGPGVFYWERPFMIVYASGEKAVLQPSYLLCICPARHLEGEEMPAEWVTADNEPLELTVEFVFGKATVADNLGRYLVKHGLAKKTRLIVPDRAIA